MALRRGPNVSWLSVYLIEEETKDWDPAGLAYVNIGGGIGHQCAQFKERFAHVPGRYFKTFNTLSTRPCRHLEYKTWFITSSNLSLSKV